MLQPSATDNAHCQKPVDILELNRIRRYLLIDSHTWDRRLCLLDSFSKSKTSASKLNPRHPELANQINIKEWKVELNDNDINFRENPEESLSKHLTLSKPPEEVDLCTMECNSNSLVEMDWSIESVEGYADHASLNLVSCQYYGEDDETLTTSEICIESSSLERLPSAASALSDQIDSLWSGNREADTVGYSGLMDNLLLRKVISPLRVNSFDSALRSRDRFPGGLSSSSLHLTSVRSFDASGNFPDMNISQRSSGSKRLNFLPSDPVFISSAYHMVGKGARLLLPQIGRDDIVFVLYDDEPSSIISYAISSRDHDDFIFSDHQSNEEAAGRSPQFHSVQETRMLQGNSTIDPKATHFRISFEDESSIPKDKVKFSVTCYFAKQFAALRKKCCPNETTFLRSLSRCKRWNPQGGKSNANFAKSLDERFIIKQVTKTELDSFEVFAPQYFKYMTESISTGSPTCLAKVLGIYQVRNTI